jgi:MFS family permease
MKDKIKKTKKLAIIEGMMFNIFFIGIQGFVMTTIALYFNATPFILALVSTLPIIAQSFQIFVIKMYKYLKTRKNILVTMSLISRAIFILLPILVYFKIKNSWILVLIIAIYSVFGTFVGNVWTAAMKEIIDEKERGVYFSKRNFFASLATMVAVYLYGFILNKFDDRQGIFYVTLIMAFFALASVFLLRKHYIPNIENINEKTSISIFKPLKNDNFKKFLLFVFFWNLSVEVAKPFFSYYQVHVLNIDKELLGFFSVISGIITMILYTNIGKIADKFGNRFLLSIGMFISTYSLLIYIFIDKNNFHLVILLDSIINAFAWSAINLAFFNLLLEVAEEPAEAYTGIYAFILSIAGITAAVLGGILGNALDGKIIKIFTGEYNGIKFIFIFAFCIRIYSILQLSSIDSYIKPFKYKGILPLNGILTKRLNIKIDKTTKELFKK